MKETPDFDDIDSNIPPHAISVVDNASDEFPILKAFQKYIDAEQTKARKRMLTLSIFFGVLLTVVISIFLVLLFSVSGQNQRLNDRLVEYMIKEHDRQSSAVVQPTTDNTHILAKIDAMQQKLEETARKAAEDAARAQAERAEAERKASAAVAESTKGPTPADLEIARLKLLLESERQKAEAERERRHKEEVEAYRRKLYPEYYQKQDRIMKQTKRPLPTEDLDDDSDSDIQQMLNDLESDEPIDYFKEEQSTTYSIPVEVNGSSKSWRIPK